MLSQAVSISSQQKLKFNQRIREKELSGELISKHDLLLVFKQFSRQKFLVDNVYQEIDDRNDEEYLNEISYKQELHAANVELNLDYFGVFCFKYLPSFTLDQILSTHLLSHVAAFLEENMIKISSSRSYDSTMTDYFSCIEMLVDDITLKLTSTACNFELYAEFFLVFLKCVWLYLKPYKQPDLECVESQNEATLVINSILVKVSNLVEAKFSDLSEAKNELSLLRLCKVYAYLLEYFKENSKAIVVLWKACYFFFNEINNFIR